MSRILFVKASCPRGWEIYHTPPLGLMCLAGFLKARGRHEFAFADLRMAPGQYHELARLLASFRPDILAVSALSVESASAHRAARLARDLLGHACRVVFGGPYPSATPGAALADPAVDFTISGEGELAFHRLVQAFSQGEAPGDIPGLGFRRDGKICLIPPGDFIQDLDSLPLPHWDLADLPRYWKLQRTSYLPSRPYMPVFTSRACPYQCTYCHNLFGKGFRARSPESVVDEIEVLMRDKGVKDIEIIDDIFNLDRERALAICDGLVARGLKPGISFPNGLRSDLLDEELLARMKRAGTYFLSVAVETASPRLQKAIRKNLNLEKVKRAIGTARKLGINTNGFFMLGFPTETEAEMRQTIRFACQSRLNFAAFFTVRAFPGTPLHRMLEEQGRAIPAHDHNYQVFRGNLAGIPEDRFRRLFRNAYLRFYSRSLSRLFLSGAFLRADLPRGLRTLARRLIQR